MNSETYETTSKKFTNSYEAAYYLMCGAKIVEVTVKKLSYHQSKKRGLRYQWVFRMDNIPTNCISDWSNHKAVGSLREFAEARIKVKQKVKQLLKY